MISRRLEAELHRAPARDHLGREEVARVDRLAVRSDRIDLIGGIPPANETVGTTTAREARDDDNIAPPDRLLALHAGQAHAVIEDQVVPLTVVEGLVHADTEPDGGRGDLDLGDRPLLVGGEHPTIVVAPSDN
jgi:hypothetical protein